MNSLSQPDPFQQQLERLVDGELSHSEVRDLLALIETEPDGWRRCALTFLEDHTWRRDIARVLEPTDSQSAFQVPLSSDAPRPLTSPLNRRDTARSSRWQAQSAWPAVAAAIMVGFLAGFFVPRSGSTVSPAPHPSDIVKPSRAPQPETGLIAQDRSFSSSGPDHLEPSPEDSAQTWTVVVPNGSYSPGTGIHLPLVAYRDQQNVPLLQTTNAMSDELAERLRREGNIVRRHQQIETVRLSDGREIAIPYEDWEVVPVSLHAIP